MSDVSDDSEKYYRVHLFADLSMQFSDAFYVLNREHPRVMSLPQVKQFLVCRSLELALKGWLILRDDTQTLRRLSGRDYGHNLVALAEAGRQHYPAIVEYLPLINDLNESYQGKQYEYPHIDNPEAEFAVAVDLVPFADFCAGCMRDLYSAYEAWAERHATE